MLLVGPDEKVCTGKCIASSALEEENLTIIVSKWTAFQPDHGSVILCQIEGAVDVQCGQRFLEGCDCDFGQPLESLVENGRVFSLNKPQHTKLH